MIDKARRYINATRHLREAQYQRCATISGHCPQCKDALKDIEKALNNESLLRDSLKEYYVRKIEQDIGEMRELKNNQ